MPAVWIGAGRSKCLRLSNSTRSAARIIDAAVGRTINTVPISCDRQISNCTESETDVAHTSCVRVAQEEGACVWSEQPLIISSTDCVNAIAIPVASDGQKTWIAEIKL